MIISDNFAFMTLWPWHPIAMLIWVITILTYILGWRQMRRRYPRVATPRRLVFFIGAMLLIALAIFSPLDPLSHHLLSARTLQKLLLGMIAPPLIWLSCPFHVMIYALPRQLRHRITRQVIRPSKLQTMLRFCTRPTVAWIAFVCAFLLWHDPGMVGWTLVSESGRMAILGLMFATALLYWQHIVKTGPRIHKRYPGWLLVAYLITVEIANMAAGVTLAFTTEPIYAHYVAAHAAGTSLPFINALEDQMLTGAMVWVTGSIIYISSIVMILSQLFAQEDGTPPRLSASLTATRRTIAPGLEHRARD